MDIINKIIIHALYNKKEYEGKEYLTVNNTDEECEVLVLGVFVSHEYAGVMVSYKDRSKKNHVRHIELFNEMYYLPFFDALKKQYDLCLKYEITLIDINNGLGNRK